MKNTMNKSDVAKFHKYLAQENSLNDISKAMQISIECLARFAPSVFDKLKKKAAKTKEDDFKKTSQVPKQAG